MTDNDATTDRLGRLCDQGVAIWLDDLSRERLSTGNLQALVDERDVVGVTTNPTIFQAAITKSSAYDDQLRVRSGQGSDADTAVRDLTTDDVRGGLRPAGTRGPANRRSRRPGVHRGRPAAGPRHRATVAAGPLPVGRGRPAEPVRQDPCDPSRPAGDHRGHRRRYQRQRHPDLLDRALPRGDGGVPGGPRAAGAAGDSLDGIASVASFFVSRVDSEVDKRLDTIGTDEALGLRGQAAVANARLAYQAYEQVVAADRWQRLEAAGAARQRPLWASTSTKNPDYSDTLYVTELVAPETVNTMPEATLEAVADHGEIRGDTVRSSYDRPGPVFDRAGRRRGRHGRRRRGYSRTRAWRSSRRAGSTCSPRSRPSSRRVADDGHGLGTVRADDALVADLVADRVASRIAAGDATLWGPAAEEEAAVRLGWVTLRAARDRCSPRSRHSRPTCAPRASTASCSAAWAGRRSLPR